MNPLFTGAILALMGAGAYLNGEQNARASAEKVKTGLTGWLLKRGVRHSAEDERRVLLFNIGFSKFGGTLAMAWGLFLVCTTLAGIRDIPTPTAADSGPLGWWLIVVAVSAGIWRWKARQTHERIITALFFAYGIFLLYRHYTAS